MTSKTTKKINKTKKQINRNIRKVEQNQTVSTLTDLSSLVVFSIASAIIFLSLAYINYPIWLNYNFRYNWISDLGNQLLNPSGWYWFTLGCIITGFLLFVIFAKNPKVSLRIFGFFMSAGLIGVGAFSSLFFVQHTLFAQWYFLGSLICILIMSFSLLPKKSCIFGFIAAIFNILFLIFFSQLLEWIAFVTNFAFINYAATIRN